MDKILSNTYKQLTKYGNEIGPESNAQIITRQIAICYNVGSCLHERQMQKGRVT